MQLKTRLHKFIWQNTHLKQNYTRPEIMRNIENFGVFIDNEVCKNRLQWVWEGQKIDLNHWPKREIAPLEKIEILEENENFLIILKPFGVPVQPGNGHENDNLFSWLLNKFEEQKEILKNAPPDSNASKVAGIVHRLDKKTQGLMLIAKNLKWHEKLQNEFRERKVGKKYLTKIEGKMEENMEITGFQARNFREPLKQKFFLNEIEAKKYDEKARNSHTIFKPIFYCEEKNQSLVEVKIKTGRMHQIRVTAEFLGFPLVQDHLYNQKYRTFSNNLTHENIQKNEGAVKTINLKDWEKLEEKIFKNHEFGLLANELEIKHYKIQKKIIDINKLGEEFLN